MMTSKFMRILSVLGIFLLLALQYVWLKNAYQLVEREIMEKSKVCLKEAMDEELFERLDRKKIPFRVFDCEKLEKGTEVINGKIVNNSSDINIAMQEGLSFIGYPCSTKKIDTIFQKKILVCFGFKPEHSIRIVEDSTRFIETLKIINSGKANEFITGMDSIYKNDSCKIYNVICDNTIFIKLNEKQSLELVLTSPTSTVINKARYIFAISLLLVILIGVIMVFQFTSMMKEKEFVAFIKDYTRTLAHEMRTPINGIYMLTSRLISVKNKLDTETENKYHKECLNLCSRLILTVDNILLVARAEQVGVFINKTETDMRVFIENMVEKYRNNCFQTKEINITTHFEPENCMAFIDSDLMENAVCNLMENAIKYSNQSVEINISCSIDTGKLILRVRDNGFGISQNDLKYIFRIFERGKKVNSKLISGFGIGLHYVEKVVKAHSGSIQVISAEGAGSEFIISIPNKSEIVV